MRSAAWRGRPAPRFEGEGVPKVHATLVIEEPGKARPFLLYVPLEFWGRAAEVASTLSAQDLITVVGKLGWTKKRSKAGEEYSTLVVEVGKVEVLDAAAVEAGV